MEKQMVYQQCAAVSYFAFLFCCGNPGETGIIRKNLVKMVDRWSRKKRAGRLPETMNRRGGEACEEEVFMLSVDRAEGLLCWLR